MSEQGVGEARQSPEVVIKPEHKAILDTVRSVWTEHGARVWETPESHGGVDKYRPSNDGTLQISFDYGTPQRLETSDGSYTILGSHVSSGDMSAAFEDLKGKLGQNYDLEIAKPQRDDGETRRRSELEFQLQYSGPWIRLKPKQV